MASILANKRAESFNASAIPTRAPITLSLLEPFAKIVLTKTAPAQNPLGSREDHPGTQSWSATLADPDQLVAVLPLKLLVPFCPGNIVAWLFIRPLLAKTKPSAGSRPVTDGFVSSLADCVHPPRSSRKIGSPYHGM
jgi:hypothetical protein